MIRNMPAIALGFCMVLLAAGISRAAGDDLDGFDFDPDAFEKKSLQWGGYVEGKFEQFSYNEDSALYFLNVRHTERSTLDRMTGTLQLVGSYSIKKSSFNWLLKASASQDQDQYDDWANVYEAYLRLRPTDTVTVEAGKQSYKWGTGYAWNPVGFLNRRKDPNDPDEDMEGFVSLETSWVRSVGSTLESMAASVSILPVWDGVNDDFGRKDNINLAAKLYFLVKNTDIDFLYFTGDSRSSRYGIDFASNLATNFAIHGEFSWIPHADRVVLEQNGELRVEESSSASFLLGMRYLSEQNITTILEYYHNGSGYSEEEMSRYYQLVNEAQGESDPTVATLLLEKAQTVSQNGYGAFQNRENYGYARITWKEPYDIVYFTPGITGIINLDDNSWTLTPELLYTGFTNWELRLRYSLLNGADNSEYGEKTNTDKIELRIRYFF